MTNNEPWEEDSIKIEDAKGNLAYEVIDVIKPIRLSPINHEPPSDWRRELEIED
tara:strand:- start:387 stop:548 length:162 start_codon:yes stop_codon:yes gene_type:complete